MAPAKTRGTPRTPTTAKTPEHRRLEEARTGEVAVEGVGPVPQRAPVGHGARGLQRRRRRLELLPPRPGPLARLPLGRGRDRRDLRRAPAAVPGAGAVERRRPDPQGADVRPHQRRGQPRRGRQGVLVLPRQHPDALLPEVPVQVPPARVPLRGPGRHQRAAAASRTWSTSCSTPASSTTTATSTWSSSTPRRAHDDILMLVTAHNRGPDAATLHLLPTLWFRNTWSWGDEVAKPTLDGRRRRSRESPRRAPPTPSSATWRLRADASAELLFCENETNNAAPVRRAQRLAVRQGRDQRLRGARRRATRSTRRAPAPRSRPITCSRSRRATAPRSACG